MSERSAPFPPPIPGAGWRAGGVELAERVALVVEQARAGLGDEVEISGPDPRLGLATLFASCATRLRTLPPGARVDMAELCVEIDGLFAQFSERRLTERARQVADCERGLARLREITTTAGLIDGVCDELVRSVGLRRAMLGRVENGMWRPWKGNSAMLAEAWVAEWIETAIPLNDLTLETRLLDERRPELILDTNQPGIARMVHAAGVRSYVVAPIMPGGQVVGFLHADHGAAGRTCDEVDRDLLWMFAEGFGHLYERTALAEQLHARTEQVRRTVSGLTDALDELAGAELSLMKDGAAESHPAVLREDLGSRLNRLTTRELEVFELLVAGARNGEIAGRLTVTVGTVKSHVKNILAKLGVVNRSQAIAMYLDARTFDSPASGYDSPPR